MRDNVGYDFVDPTVVSVPQAVVDDFEPVVREYGVMPLGIQDGILVVAAEDPSDHNLLETLEFICNRPIRLVAGSPTAISLAIQRHYIRQIARGP